MDQETVLWLAAAALWGSASVVCLLRHRYPPGPGRQALIAGAAAMTAAAITAHDSNRQVARLRDCLLTTLDIAAAPAPPGGRTPPAAPVRLVR